MVTYKDHPCSKLEHAYDFQRRRRRDAYQKDAVDDSAKEGCRSAQEQRQLKYDGQMLAPVFHCYHCAKVGKNHGELHCRKEANQKHP